MREERRKRAECKANTEEDRAKQIENEKKKQILKNFPSSLLLFFTLAPTQEQSRAVQWNLIKPSLRVRGREGATAVEIERDSRWPHFFEGQFEVRKK